MRCNYTYLAESFWFLYSHNYSVLIQVYIFILFHPNIVLFLEQAPDLGRN